MKKLLSIITIVLFISMLNGITTTAMAASEKKPIMGDVDQSGQVDAQDAVQILKYVAHNIELSEDALKLANTDGIGKVDAQDAVMILKYVAHNITEFPGKIDVIDFEALDVAKNDAAKYKEADYSKTSYKKLKDALAMPETTQKEVDSKVKAIRNAIAGLTTDASKLSAAKIEAAKYAEEDYSAASYRALKNALAMPEKTQVEIDAKANAITNAIAGLKIDASALNKAKTDAAKYKEEDYSKASYKILKDALAMPETTQKEIDAKAKAITSAIAQLRTDVVELNAAKTEAAKYAEADYSVASYKALKDALAMPETTQKQIDSKAKAITSAIAGLNTDTSKLSVAKIEAAKYAEEDYSAASYKVLKNALAMPEKTQVEIDAKAKAITNAIAGLTTDVSALNTAKTDAAKYAEEDYSKASYKILKDALVMPETTQKEIDSKAKAITAAIAQLRTDVAALNAAKTEAAKYLEADYSVVSYKVLKDAISMPENTQKEIDSKEKAIISAIAQLRTDKTNLDEAETEAAKYLEADYSVASYKALKDALDMPEATQKQIDDKTAAITTAINGLEKKLAHVNVIQSEQDTVLKYKPLDIATITSGDKEEKISIENLEYNVIYADIYGNETTDKDAINQFTTIKLDYVETDNRTILVNFIGKKAGTYTIKVNVGSIDGTQEIKVTVEENTELNHAELVGTIPETIRVNQILTELGIEFSHKYTDTDLLPIESVLANDLTIDTTGMTVTLLDENKTALTELNENNTLIVVRNAEVKYITIEFTEVGNSTLKIKLGEQTILNMTFTVQAEAVTSVKLYDRLFEDTVDTVNEVTSINLYKSENAETVEYIDEEDDSSYICTLLPIYLDDGAGTRNKINESDILFNSIEDGKVTIQAYKENTTYRVTPILVVGYCKDEITGKIRPANEGEDIDYIGIAIANTRKADELVDAYVEFKYGTTSNNLIKINICD